MEFKVKELLLNYFHAKVYALEDINRILILENIDINECHLNYFLEKMQAIKKSYPYYFHKTINMNYL